MTSSRVVTMEGVGKRYSTAKGEDVDAVTDVSFEVRRGETLAIVGPSGCGKSTLCNIISGVARPDQGRVLIDGDDVSGRVGLVGYMPQKDLLLPWRTVLDNVVLGLEVMGVARAEARAEAMPLFDEFGLAGFESVYPYALSGGMRQRAAFMRTVMFNKSVLILDEPFGALDALTRAAMQEWLLGLWAKLGHTILLVTHDVEEAVLLSDRVYVMSGRPGEIRAEIDVSLPRPRTYELAADPAFMERKLEILRTLRANALEPAAAS